MNAEVGPWFTVKNLMMLRDQSKHPNSISPRVRGCIDLLAQRELELKAKLLMLGL